MVKPKSILGRGWFEPHRVAEKEVPMVEESPKNSVQTSRECVCPDLVEKCVHANGARRAAHWELASHGVYSRLDVAKQCYDTVEPVRVKAALRATQSQVGSAPLSPGRKKQVSPMCETEAALRVTQLHSGSQGADIIASRRRVGGLCGMNSAGMGEGRREMLDHQKRRATAVSQHKKG